MYKKYRNKSHMRHIANKNKMEDANTTTWKTTLSESELNNVIKMQSLWNWIKNLAIYNLRLCTLESNIQINQNKRLGNSNHKKTDVVLPMSGK